MKKYYIDYYLDFGNTYSLYSVECDADREALARIAPNAERITLKAARHKIRNEQWARIHDRAFSGFGDTTITPAAEALVEYAQYMY